MSELTDDCPTVWSATNRGGDDIRVSDQTGWAWKDLHEINTNQIVERLAGQRRTGGGV